MATNKRPNKKYKPKNNERQTLRTMPSVMAWILEPLQQLLDELRKSGCIMTDESDQPLMIDRFTGTCFAFNSAAKPMLVEFEVMFDRYGADKSMLDPIQVIFERIEAEDGITEQELADAEQAMKYIRAVVGRITVREYRELYSRWKDVHRSDPSHRAASRSQMRW